MSTIYEQPVPTISPENVTVEAYVDERDAGEVTTVFLSERGREGVQFTAAGARATAAVLVEAADVVDARAKGRD